MVIEVDGWVVETGVVCVVCPGCAFTFSAEHTDTGTDTYSCPVCENERLRRALDEAQLRSIEARNPGIDMAEVRRFRAGGDEHGESPMVQRCGPTLHGFECVLPAGHNMGQVDIPEHHRAGPSVVPKPLMEARTFIERHLEDDPYAERVLIELDVWLGGEGSMTEGDGK